MNSFKEEIMNGQAITYKDLVVSPLGLTVTMKGEEVRVSLREFLLLWCLATNQERATSRDRILDKVWEDSINIEPRIVDVYMGYLRKKIDKRFHVSLIQTVHGFGYMLKLKGGE